FDELHRRAADVEDGVEDGLAHRGGIDAIRAHDKPKTKAHSLLASPRVTKRRTLAIAAAVALAIVVLFALIHRPYPSDRTPEGAYMRIAKSVAAEDPRGFFAYLETEA